VKDYLINTVIWWAIIWVLYTFWTGIFAETGTFFAFGAVAAILVALSTWAGAPDMCLWEDDPLGEDDEDHSGWP
jgi:hypothetical protein